MTERGHLTSEGRETVRAAEELLGCDVTLEILEEQLELHEVNWDTHKNTWTVWLDIFRSINATKMKLQSLYFWNFIQMMSLKQKVNDLEQKLRQAGYTFPISEFQKRYEQAKEIQRQQQDKIIEESKIIKAAKKALTRAVHREIYEIYKDVFPVRNGEHTLLIPSALEIKKLLKQTGRIISVDEILKSDIAEGKIKRSFELAIRWNNREEKDEYDGREERMQEISRGRSYEYIKKKERSRSEERERER